MRSPSTGSPSASRNAAPWATRQYRHPFAWLTTTAISSRSAVPRFSVGSCSALKCANHRLSRSGRNEYTRNTFGTNPSASRAFANSPWMRSGSSRSSGTGKYDPVSVMARSRSGFGTNAP